MTTSVAPVSRHSPAASRGRAQRQHLGVRGRVSLGLAHVVAATEHLAVRVHDHGADRYVGRGQREPGLVEGEPHPLVVPAVCHEPEA